MVMRFLRALFYVLFFLYKMSLPDYSTLQEQYQTLHAYIGMPLNGQQFLFDLQSIHKKELISSY